MKNFTKLLFLFLFCCTSGFAQVQVGNGSVETENLPIEPYYGYSYTQTIYLQSDINSAGTITGIQYFYSGVSDLANSDDDIQIWMGHTATSSFATTSSWEAVSGMTLVYSGSLPAPTSPGTDEWLMIDITDFAYNNTDNLVIAIDANEAGYDSSSDDFHCTAVPTAQSIRYYSDSTNPDPASPPTGGIENYIANIILDGLAPPTTPNCASPSSPADAGSVGISCGGEITLEWNAPSSGPTPDSYDVYFGTTSGSLAFDGNTASTSYTVTAAANSTYYWQIIPKAGTEAASGCAEWSFSTTTTVDEGTGDQNYLFLNSYVPGGPVYSWIDPVANGHTEITSWTSGSDDDGYFTVADMGITFNYYDGIGETSCHIGTNGYVSFGSGYTSTGGSTTIPSTSDPDNMIAVCMMDLDDRADGQIFYATVGGNFVVTWLHYHDYSDDNEWISAQLVLDGDLDGGFTIHFNEAESSATIPDILADAVIGAEFGTTEGIIYRTNGDLGPIFCSPLAVRFENGGAALPVELVSFNAKAMEDENMVTWSTASEENTEWHVIERSVDGRSDWTELGRVPAAGTSTEIISYEFMDEKPLAVGYYRLRSVDFDAYVDMSAVVRVERERVSGEVNVYPNPTKGMTNVDFELAQSETVIVTLTDITGKVISYETISAERGANNHQVEMANLSDGIYFISMETSLGKTTERIVKN